MGAINANDIKAEPEKANDLLGNVDDTNIVKQY